MSVGETHPVNIHAHMLRTERSHIDGFQTSKTSVILDLHAGEIFQGVGDRG